MLSWCMPSKTSNQTTLETFEPAVVVTPDGEAYPPVTPRPAAPAGEPGTPPPQGWAPLQALTRWLRSPLTAARRSPSVQHPASPRPPGKQGCARLQPAKSPDDFLPTGLQQCIAALPPEVSPPLLSLLCGPSTVMLLPFTFDACYINVLCRVSPEPLVLVAVPAQRQRQVLACQGVSSVVVVQSLAYVLRLGPACNHLAWF